MKTKAINPLLGTLILSFILSVNSIFAQDIKLSKSTLTIQQFMTEIQKQSELSFILSEQDIDPSQSINIDLIEGDIKAILKAIEAQGELKFQRISNTIVITLAKKKGGAEIYQLLKGVVRDADLGTTLPGANIIIAEFPDKSVSSDENGEFEATVPVGRLHLIVSYIGYESAQIPLLLNSGNQPYLTIDLKSSIENLDQVTIIAEHDKSRTINPMAYASGRSFSINEAYRYAGTLGDPARMVRSYAGVVPERDDRNDIIVRGNSPTTVQWRLDNIEIPNPNHFGGMGLTGSTVTLLNINLLDNSDFLTGAFPAEYGNVTGSVFDLKLRKPNPESHQFRFQTGWNGFEVGAEGPISKSKKIGTYMVDYRYSFLDLMQHVGLDYGILPEFQDLTVKFDFPVSDRLSLSAIGLWGESSIELDDRDDDPENIVGSYGEDLKTSSDMLIAGVNLKYRITDQTFIETGVNALQHVVGTDIDTFNVVTNNSASTWDEQSTEEKYSFYADVTSYTSSRNRIQSGVKLDLFEVDYQTSGVIQNEVYRSVINETEGLYLMRAYVEDEYKFTPRFKSRVGLHTIYMPFNESFGLEPRTAAQYQLSERHALSASYGKHHQMQPRLTYFTQTHLADGSVVQINENLDFTSADHFVIGYDFNLTKNLRFKAESYYQDIDHVPVEQNPNSTYSMVNVGANFFIPNRDSLVNEGRARNYGVELTLERFLDKGYYFLINTSLFQSEYQAQDGVWRNTAFNANYIFNAMGGYEYWVTPTKAFGFDIKSTIAGGKRYTPVNESASIASGEVIFDESQAFARQFDDYFRTDLKIYYRFNFPKVFMEFAMDLQNITNSQNYFSRQFVPESGRYEEYYQMGFFPMATFKCQF